MATCQGGAYDRALRYVGRILLTMEEEPNLKLSVYESLVGDTSVQGLVWRLLKEAGLDDSVGVSPMDVAAARRYLRRCLLNMSMGELASLQTFEAAALWAKGAIGAARYRQQLPPETGDRRVKKRARLR